MPNPYTLWSTDPDEVVATALTREYSGLVAVTRSGEGVRAIDVRAGAVLIATPMRRDWHARVWHLRGEHSDPWSAREDDPGLLTLAAEVVLLERPEPDWGFTVRAERHLETRTPLGRPPAAGVIDALCDGACGWLGVDEPWDEMLIAGYEERLHGQDLSDWGRHLPGSGRALLNDEYDTAPPRFHSSRMSRWAW